jgi:5,10-methylenetetrahydromethanopterin reductase
MEVWLHAFSFPHRVAKLARQAEDWGFTGVLLADSQNLNADIWVELATAGMATSRIRLGPGVTNPVTRHLAVTASAAAALQAETAGRATLGIGRGDSALTQIGRHPVPVAEFERGLDVLQGYLRGEEVELDGTRSAIRWLVGAELPKVPVHVAATGPRTIQAAARHAEGVDLTVGAELERLRWGAGIARNAAPAGLIVGAYVNVAVHPDREVARELVRGSVSTFARFATHGAPDDGLSEVTKRGIDRLASGYEKDRHGEAAGAYAQLLDGEFIDRFAVAGPAEEVRDRLAEIRAAGIERLVIVPCSLDANRTAVEESNERFANNVLSELIA